MSPDIQEFLKTVIDSAPTDQASVIVSMCEFLRDNRVYSLADLKEATA